MNLIVFTPDSLIYMYIFEESSFIGGLLESS